MYASCDKLARGGRSGLAQGSGPSSARIGRQRRDSGRSLHAWVVRRSGGGSEPSERRSVVESRTQDEISDVLVVAERGSVWPSWLPVCENQKERQVIVQGEDEALAELAERVRERCRERLGFDAVVVACSDRADDAAQAARSRFVRAAADNLVSTGGGRIYLTARSRSSGRSRGKLSELAAHLGAEWEGSEVTVTVRFGSLVSPPKRPGHDLAGLSRGMRQNAHSRVA